MPKSPAPTAPPEALHEAHALLRAGLAASQADDAQRALELFAQASALFPASGMPHFLAGSEHAALGQFDQAEEALANAVLLAPAFHIARYQLGLLQFSSGRAAAALVSWEHLFALADANALGHFVRGFAALAQDKLAGARVHFEAGLARNTDNPALSADIQNVLQGINRGQVAQPSPVDARENEPATAHVLVANYGKYGTLH